MKVLNRYFMYKLEYLIADKKHGMNPTKSFLKTFPRGTVAVAT